MIFTILFSLSLSPWDHPQYHIILSLLLLLLSSVLPSLSQNFAANPPAVRVVQPIPVNVSTCHRIPETTNTYYVVDIQHWISTAAIVGQVSRDRGSRRLSSFNLGHQPDRRAVHLSPHRIPRLAFYLLSFG